MVKSESIIEILESEYKALVRDANFLACLEAIGVDNWQGYDDAIKMFKEDFNE